MTYLHEMLRASIRYPVGSAIELKMIGNIFNSEENEQGDGGGYALESKKTFYLFEEFWKPIIVGDIFFFIWIT